MTHTRCYLTRDELENLLLEDAPYGDLTTTSLGIGQRPAHIRFNARDPMVVCGIEEAASLFELAGAEEVRQESVSGGQAVPGTRLLSARGQAGALFLAWKVAQSLVESLSGVSSCTSELLALAQGTVVACTRKHLPGSKALMVKAVRAGGGAMHRMGLSESIMVTAEHRLFLDRERLETYPTDIGRRQPEKRVVVEVDSVDAALRLVEQGCDVIQLEKLPPREVAQVVTAAAVSQNGQRPVIAAAGGINRDNAAEYAATGVDLLVTSAPYFARPRDVQVTFEAV